MTVHIVGGGVAGLAAAIGCVQRGRAVVLYEASPDLGGRCRTYDSAEIGTAIDNGAHAVLANNTSIQKYLRIIGAQGELEPHGREGLRFFDVRDQATWRLKLPDALWSAVARPPGTTAFDLLSGLKLLLSRPHRTAADALRATPIAVQRIWEPLCTAALNTPLVEASAATLGRMARGMAAPGGLNAGLLLPRQSLTQTFIQPAEAWLLQHGAIIRRQSSLRDSYVTGTAVTALVFDQTIPLGPSDSVILAVPPWSPVLAPLRVATTRFAYAPIVNAHFKLAQPWAWPSGESFVGLIGGLSQWAWVRGDVLSVTVSAADVVVTRSADDIAAVLWAEIAPLIGQTGASLPTHHIIKERRATLRHTPGLERLRPSTQTRFSNLLLAGDWVNTDLACTLESAAQSGFAAAEHA